MQQTILALGDGEVQLFARNGAVANLDGHGDVEQ